MLLCIIGQDPRRGETQVLLPFKDWVRVKGVKLLKV